MARVVHQSDAAGQLYDYPRSPHAINKSTRDTRTCALPAVRRRNENYIIEGHTFLDNPAKRRKQEKFQENKVYKKKNIIIIGGENREANETATRVFGEERFVVLRLLEHPPRAQSVLTLFASLFKVPPVR